ncbi:MAG: hypothetical protein N3E36_05350 [Sulfolobales archaeon]|nr:hypothetical protein [Sulfolobales archaeon]MCX8199435.1 hypothetical protein [Sulfolobales archaeon]MDW8170250.1 hypothetical protein [Desulfurococcaceae archaeon]
MFKHCPGAKSIVRPQIIVVECPYCRREVEFFEYEVEVECPNCRRIVRRNPSQSCIFWCNAAIDCLKNLVALNTLTIDRANELLNLIERYKKSK